MAFGSQLVGGIDDKTTLAAAAAPAAAEGAGPADSTEKKADDVAKDFIQTGDAVAKPSLLSRTCTSVCTHWSEFWTWLSGLPGRILAYISSFFPWFRKTEAAPTAETQFTDKEKEVVACFEACKTANVEARFFGHAKTLPHGQGMALQKFILPFFAEHFLKADGTVFASQQELDAFLVAKDSATIFTAFEEMIGDKGSKKQIDSFKDKITDSLPAEGAPTLADLRAAFVVQIVIEGSSILQKKAPKVA